MQLVERSPRHSVDAAKHRICQLAIDLLLERLAISLHLLALRTALAEPREVHEHHGGHHDEKDLGERQAARLPSVGAARPALLHRDEGVVIFDNLLQSAASGSPALLAHRIERGASALGSRPSLRRRLSSTAALERKTSALTPRVEYSAATSKCETNLKSTR